MVFRCRTFDPSTCRQRMEMCTTSNTIRFAVESLRRAITFMWRRKVENNWSHRFTPSGSPKSKSSYAGCIFVAREFILLVLFCCSEKSFFRGPWFLTPPEVPGTANRFFYRQELMLSTVHDTSPIVGVVGRCAVLEYNDYISSKELIYWH